MVESTSVEPARAKSTTVKSTTVKSTTVKSTTVKSTGVEATTAAMEATTAAMEATTAAVESSALVESPAPVRSGASAATAFGVGRVRPADHDGEQQSRRKIPQSLSDLGPASMVANLIH
jgi:hypothetical protein